MTPASASTGIPSAAAVRKALDAERRAIAGLAFGHEDRAQRHIVGTRRRSGGDIGDAVRRHADHGVREPLARRGDLTGRLQVGSGRADGGGELDIGTDRECEALLRGDPRETQREIAALARGEVLVAKQQPAPSPAADRGGDGFDRLARLMAVGDDEQRPRQRGARIAS